MGKLLYGPSLEVVFDDRVLAHLQLAIGQKLRRREGFFFSWRDESNDGNGRSTIWLEPSIPIVFRYNGGRMPTVNREWLEVLVASANSAQGLQLTDEPAQRGIAEER
ncbi:MAG: hypothetical protein JWN36_1635 [Microbacteriaceae bacterium]|nr:hypothetical protein [Microbacteriaceae bacterium]